MPGLTARATICGPRRRAGLGFGFGLDTGPGWPYRTPPVAPPDGVDGVVAGWSGPTPPVCPAAAAGRAISVASTTGAASARGNRPARIPAGFDARASSPNP